MDIEDKLIVSSMIREEFREYIPLGENPNFLIDFGNCFDLRIFGERVDISLRQDFYDERLLSLTGLLGIKHDLEYFKSIQ